MDKAEAVFFLIAIATYLLIRRTEMRNLSLSWSQMIEMINPPAADGGGGGGEEAKKQAPVSLLLSRRFALNETGGGSLNGMDPVIVTIQPLFCVCSRLPAACPTGLTYLLYLLSMYRVPFDSPHPRALHTSSRGRS